MLERVGLKENKQIQRAEPPAIFTELGRHRYCHVFPNKGKGGSARRVSIEGKHSLDVSQWRQ